MTRLLLRSWRARRPPAAATTAMLLVWKYHPTNYPCKIFLLTFFHIALYFITTLPLMCVRLPPSTDPLFMLTHRAGIPDARRLPSEFASIAIVPSTAIAKFHSTCWPLLPIWLYSGFYALLRATPHCPALACPRLFVQQTFPHIHSEMPPLTCNCSPPHSTAHQPVCTSSPTPPSVMARRNRHATICPPCYRCLRVTGRRPCKGAGRMQWNRGMKGRGVGSSKRRNRQRGIKQCWIVIGGSGCERMGRNAHC